MSNEERISALERQIADLRLVDPEAVTSFANSDDLIKNAAARRDKLATAEEQARQSQRHANRGEDLRWIFSLTGDARVVEQQVYWLKTLEEAGTVLRVEGDGGDMAVTLKAERIDEVKTSIMNVLARLAHAPAPAPSSRPVVISRASNQSLGR